MGWKRQEAEQVKQANRHHEKEQRLGAELRHQGRMRELRRTGGRSGEVDNV